MLAMYASALAAPSTAVLKLSTRTAVLCARLALAASLALSASSADRMLVELLGNDSRSEPTCTSTLFAFVSSSGHNAAPRATRATPIAPSAGAPCANGAVAQVGAAAAAAGVKLTDASRQAAICSCASNLPG
eukprot:scaffold43208_cov74-Phaeocystis_antarctica.AAC.2